VRFSKLHGAGNDFLLFDGGEDPALETALPPLVSRLCHRRLGVGADGVLLLTPHEAHVLRTAYWNSDGSVARFCANGTRCAARFAAERWGWRDMVLVTGFADVPACVNGDAVTLELPAPGAVEPWQDLAADGETFACRFIVVGVPQLVVPVEWHDFWERPLVQLAPVLRAHHDLPPGGANVNFVMVQHGLLAVRSWERGVEGETLSCGSGDVASALVAAVEAWLQPPVSVVTASRRILIVEPLGEPPACPSRLTGPAEWVADGVVEGSLLGSG
jgi:diaminopimelate epimerase